MHSHSSTGSIANTPPTKSHSLALISLVIMFSAIVSQGLQAQEVSGVKPPKTQPSGCPDAKYRKGEYVNDIFGFSVEIPAPLEGFSNSPCTDDCACIGDHGRIIPINPVEGGPSRHMEVFAGYALEEDVTVTMQVNAHMKWIRGGAWSGSLEILKRYDVKLDGLPAQRLVVQYIDKKKKEIIVEDFIETARKGVEYSLYLRTRKPHYREDVALFNQLVASFRLIDGSHLQ